MNILLSGSQGGQNIQIENYEAEHVAGAGGEQRLLLLQGLFWLVKCPHNEEIRANTDNGQHTLTCVQFNEAVPHGVRTGLQPTTQHAVAMFS